LQESRKIALFKTRYEIEKKEKEIKLLAAENQLQTTVAENQKQQKRFAYAILFFIILIGSYAFFRYRIRKKAEVDQAKLKDRLNISQGLHDDIGSTLSSISVYSKVAQKLNEKNSKEELNEILGKINVTSFEMISEMNDIVWAIHPKNDSMEKIILRMESYARPMLMTKNITLKLEYDPCTLTANLEMEKRKNFYLVFKEAVNNAFKYSGCSEIITRISNSKDRIEMRIKDNGVSFDVRQEIKGDKLTLTGNG
jgi:signal transduction histidine kinase